MNAALLQTHSVMDFSHLAKAITTVDNSLYEDS